MSTSADVIARMKEVGYRDLVTDQELRDALDYLTKSRLVEPFRDYAALNSGLDAMILRQEAWALTRTGRAVVTAVRVAVTDARRALQLPARLLDGTERTIRQLLEHVDTDQGLLPGDLEDVRTRLDELQRVTADFYAALAQIVQSDVTDDALFGENRDRVVEALRQFPREYERGLRRVEAALADLDATGPRQIVETAVMHGGLVDARDQQHWVDERVRRLADLAAWFAPAGSVQRLIASAAGAVHTLLVAIDRRYTAMRRGSDLAADFRELAYSLHAQPTDTDAHRVYAAAFGHWPSRHAAPGTTSEDIAYATTVAGGISRHRVDVILREHERQGRASGRPRKMPDAAPDRAAALAEAAASAARRRQFAAQLITGGEVSLRHYTGLTGEALVILLAAVEVALEHIDSATGVGEAQAEGANVLVRARIGDPAARITVSFAEGSLTGPDVRVTVSGADSAPAAHEAGVPMGAAG